MEKISEQDEKRILTSIERAIGMTSRGEHPNDALYKVATDERFSAPIVQRMVEAYNTSKTLAFIKHAAGPDRAGNFPLADTSAIVNRMYPSHVQAPAEKQAQAAIPFQYGFRESVNFNRPTLAPLPWTKVAEALPRDAAYQERKKHESLLSLRKKADMAKTAYRQQFYKVMDLAKEAGAYFRRDNHTPFAVVERQILSMHGPLGKSAMDLVAHFGSVKEARATDFPKQPFYNQSEDPYRAIGWMIDATSEFHKAASVAAKVSNLLETTEASFLPTPESGLDPVLSKKADMGELFSDAASGLGQFGMRSLGLDPNETTEKVKSKALSSVLNPIHETKLHGIKMQAVLNDFMSNDPVLSTYDPGEVASAYNQLSELAPSVARQPSVMRGMLRRMLQQEQVVEPFEAQQLTGMERHLRGLPLDSMAAAGAPPPAHK